MVYLPSILSLLLLVGHSRAVPLVGEKRGAVDSQLLNTFNLMEQYASAAYCKSNYNSPGDRIMCSSGSCPLVEAANATSVIEYASTLSTDVTGYVSIDPTNELVVVAFRGSASVQNWITNLNYKAVSTDLCSGCTAHAGFWQSWLDSRTEVLAALKQLANSYPGYKVVATGHSLGGAIASLAAAQLRNDGYDVALYTFGAPRIAGPTLSNYITNQSGGNYRITHWNDPVPRLPPIVFGFVHISPEYYINKPNGQQVGAGDIKQYDGSLNLRGNGAWLVTDILAHAWYFNSIASCLVL